MRDRIRYNRMTSEEGKKFDFSRFTSDSIKSLKIKKRSVLGLSLIALAFLVIGGITVVMGIGVIFLGIGLILIIKAIKSKEAYKIQLVVKRSNVEGSWILSHQSNIFRFNKVSPNVTEKFREYLQKF